MKREAAMMAKNIPPIIQKSRLPVTVSVAMIICVFVIAYPNTILPTTVTIIADTQAAIRRQSAMTYIGVLCS